MPDSFSVSQPPVLTDPIALPWLPGLAENPGDCEAVVDADGVEWLRIGPISATDPTAPCEIQAVEIWRRAAEMVKRAGFEPGDIVRTWLYVQDILGWYDRFNAARDAAFRDMGVTRYPASTAVGVETQGRGALVLHVLAARAVGGAKLEVAVVPSPKQGSAADYGSAFSRAIEIGTAGRRILLVSGTASIDAAGSTLHPTDGARQLAETAAVVESLLASRGFDAVDICRAMHYSACEIADTSLPRWFGPWLKSQVCRHDLHVEVELDAVRVVTSETKG